MRATIMGGETTTIVLGFRQGAFVFALQPAFGTAVIPQRKAEEQAWKDLRADFVKRSQDNNALKDTNLEWMSDLDDLNMYGRKSGGSDMDGKKVAQLKKFIGIATSELEITLDLADLIMSEESEYDAELLNLMSRRF